MNTTQHPDAPPTTAQPIPPGYVRCIDAQTGAVIYRPDSALLTEPTVQPSPPAPAPVPGIDIPGVVFDPRDGRHYYGYAPTVHREPAQMAIDPMAQRFVGLGAAAAGLGWGVGEVVNALAGATSSVAMVAAGLIVWKLIPGGAKTVVNNRTDITNNVTSTGFFGKASSTTTTTNNNR